METSRRHPLFAQFQKFFSKRRSPSNEEAAAEHPKQTFWIKVKVAKSSVVQFLEGREIPVESRVNVKGTIDKNLTPQLLIHLPREGLFLAEISLDRFATKKSVLVDVTDRKMNIFISTLKTFENEDLQMGNAKCMSYQSSKRGLSHLDSKKVFDTQSLEAIGYIDLPMYVNSDHVNFYVDDNDIFHIEAEIKGVLSRNLAVLRSGSNERPGSCGGRPRGIKMGSDTTLGMFHPGALFHKGGPLRKRNKKECVWQIGLV